MSKTTELEKTYKKLLDIYVKGEPLIEDKELKDIDFKYNKIIPYPELTDKDFNKKIYTKKEFYRNKSSEDYSGDYDDTSAKKCSQRTFTLLPHQKLVKNFLSPLTPYNGFLLYAGTGYGKTCSAISIAEQYHDIYKKKVLVILSGSLVDNFKKQIFDISKYNIKTNEANLCLGTKYPDMVLDRYSVTPETLEKRVNSLIKDKYQFMGYKELAIFLEKLKTIVEEAQRDPAKRQLAYVEKVREYFSDRLVIIDEAHNLRVPGETGKKMISEAFLEMMKHVENVKLLLLTATPMFNEATEVVWTMNLLLTNDRRTTLKKADLFDADGNITEIGKQRLADASRGYVSYMRGENPFSFPFRIYPSLNNKTDPNILHKYPTNDIFGRKIANPVKFLEIIKSDMSDYQKKVYDIFKKKFKAPVEGDIDEDLDENPDEDISNDLKNTMQVLNVVYPADGDDIKKTYGKGGFDNCFERRANKYEYKKETKKNYGEFFSYNEIENYSPKIKTILDYVISSKGIVFIYSRYYPAGLIPLAMALEHIGLTKYGTQGNITSNITIDNKFPNKKFKYIVLSRRSELSPNNDLEIAAAKTDANMEGEVIKVIIVSKIGTEGIDFKRIREIHLLEPWFNLNRAEQVIGRGVRNCSHALLPKEKRNTTIYFHANCYSATEESADLQTYRVAESKQKRIIAVERVLKENAFDCNLNKEVLMFKTEDLKIKFDIETSQGKLIKNYDVGDRDGTFICSFTKCEVKCNPELPKTIKELDNTTFEDAFITDDIDLYKRYISDLFKDKEKVYNYSNLYGTIKKAYKIVDEDIFKYALNNLVENGDLIQDRITNKYGYIIYRGDKYIFQFFSIKDLRLPIEERDDLLTKKQLRLRLNVDKLKKADKIKINTKVEEVVVKDSINNIILKEYNSKQGIVMDIIIDSYLTPLSDAKHADIKAYLDEVEHTKENRFELGLKRYMNLHKKSLNKSQNTSEPAILNKIKTQINIYKQYIVDSIIDRMNSDELIDLLNYNFNLKKPNELDDMVKKSIHPWMIKDQHFLNPYNKSLYYIGDSKKFKLSAPIDRSKEVDELYKKIKLEYTIGKLSKLDDKTKGYIQLKKDKVVYKIRSDTKHTGAVCGTSQMLEDIINYIKEITPSLLETYSTKYKKTTLCYMLEILQRQAGIFIRTKF